MRRPSRRVVANAVEIGGVLALAAFASAIWPPAGLAVIGVYAVVVAQVLGGTR